MSVTVRVPGKLMIAGEYAVLEPHQEAVVVAVDRHLTVTLQPGQATSIPRSRFIACAFATVEQYLGAPATGPFGITVGSDLDDGAGRKYGLGSSACVTVGVVAALLRHLAGGAHRETLFKLAAIAHFQAQGSGSGADVAAATFGGWLRYASFGPDWLSRRLQSGASVAEIVQGDWPNLAIERLLPPPDLQLCVGWTGRPAATAPLIQAVLALRDREPHLYQEFLARSNEAVQEFLRGMRAGDTGLILGAVRRNRAALARLGQQAGIPIETPELAAMADCAEALGGAGKPSGAGGGDCGIALVTAERDAGALARRWQAHGIEFLKIQVENVTQVTI